MNKGGAAYPFTREVTTVIKGLLIVWLIARHAVGSQHYEAAGGMVWHVMEKLAMRGGAVVSAFAFLSGYGLNETYNRWHGRRLAEGLGAPVLKDKIGFAWLRILRLLVNLWIIYAIFVGAILILRDPSLLTRSYGDNIIPGIIKNLTGNLLPIKTGTVNRSWWFICAICSFYLIYPFVKCLDGRWASAVTALSFALTVPVMDHPAGTRIFWFFQFFLGYYVSEIGLRLIPGLDIRDVFAGSLVMFLSVNALMYKFSPYPLYPLWGISLVIMMYSLWYLTASSGIRFVWKPLAVLGRYSSDIYLLHVFVHGTLFTELVYAVMNPVWVTAVDTLICLGLAYLLGCLKKRAGIDRLLTGLLPDKRPITDQ